MIWGRASKPFIRLPRTERPVDDPPNTMEQPVAALSEGELVHFPIRDLVEGWYFRIYERSMGCYVVEATDRWGRKIFKEGVEDDPLLEECAEAARAIQAQLDSQTI